MLWNGFEHTGPEPGRRRRLGRDRGERVGVERVAGQRTGQVGVAAAEPGVEGGGAGDVLLHGQVGEVGRAQVQAVR